MHGRQFTWPIVVVYFFYTFAVRDSMYASAPIITASHVRLLFIHISLWVDFYIYKFKLTKVTLVLSVHH